MQSTGYPCPFHPFQPELTDTKLKKILDKVSTNKNICTKLAHLLRKIHCSEENSVDKNLLCKSARLAQPPLTVGILWCDKTR